MANFLFLRLEGPLQSWGERARWSVRDSAPEPTKSGVVGLLGCALGVSEDDDLRKISRAIKIGVRCDRPGTVLIDYHTVVGGVMSAEGKVKRNATTKEPETVVSLRYYLCDASFLVAIQSDPQWIERLAFAVQHPVWPYYLGRKACPPTCPIYDGEGTYSSLEEAIKKDKIGKVRAVLECLPGEGIRRRDEIDSRSLHTFLPRYSREIMIDVPVFQEDL